MTPWRWTLSAALSLLSLQQASPAHPVAPAASQGETAQTPEQRLEKIRGDLAAANAAFRQAMQAAKSDEEREALYTTKAPDSLQFAQRYRELALETKGTPVAAEAWMGALRAVSGGGANMQARAKLMLEGMEVLLAEHGGSELLKELPEMLSWQLEPADAERILRALREKAGAASARVGASFVLATRLIETVELATPERAAEARRLLEEVRSKHAAVKDAYGDPFGPKVDGWLFQLDHLQPGMQVPEIEAPDLQGVTFKLSDYRGKVVLLDFWGHW